jgi:CDP-diacylglycerol--glycerol-3-phosphate 3-phosphatidyltransferase
MGALLDPIADKLLVASALILICYSKNLIPLLAGLLIGRDIWVSGIRLVAMEYRVSIPVSQLGKLKTFFENVGIFMLLTKATEIGTFPMRTVGMLAIWIALGLALVSGYQYTKLFFDLTNQKDQ